MPPHDWPYCCNQQSILHGCASECTCWCFCTLGMIPCAFSRKIALPNLAFVHEKMIDGGGVFDGMFPFDFLRLPFLPAHLFSILSWQNSGCCCWIFGRGSDKIGGKDHVERAVEDFLEDFIKTSEAVVDHQAVVKFQTLPQPALDTDLHGIQKLCWEFNIGGNAHFEDNFLDVDGGGNCHYSNHKSTSQTE